MRRQIIFLIIIILGINTIADNSKSVVQVFSVSQEYGVYTPWQKGAIRNRYGSGVVIDNKYVLTTSFVTDDSVNIELSKKGEKKRFTAEIVKTDSECGLSLLKPLDKSFFNEMESIDLSNELNIGENIKVCQWSDDGNYIENDGTVINYTSQRIGDSFNIYLYATADVVLSIEQGICTVIMSNNRLSGLSFNYIENKLNFITLPVIKHFLNDDVNYYKGFAVNIIDYSSSEDEFLRDFLQIPLDITGIIINSNSKNTFYSQILKKYDFITHIDGKKIDNNGNVWSDIYRSQPFNIYMNIKKYPDDKVVFDVIRKNKKQKIDLRLERFDPESLKIPQRIVNSRNNYLVYGGLLFIELSESYFREFGKEWYKDAPLNMLFIRDKFKNIISKDKIVLIYKVFPDDINKGYQDIYSQKVININDIDIKSIRDVKKAFQIESDTDSIIIEEPYYELVFDRKKVKDSNVRISKNYHITETEFIQ